MKYNFKYFLIICFILFSPLKVSSEPKFYTTQFITQYGHYEKIKGGGYDFILKRYNLPQFSAKIHPRGYGSGYLAQSNNNLLILSPNGSFNYISLENFKKDFISEKIFLKPIRSNLKKFINLTHKWYDASGPRFGVRDIFVKENNIYISLVGSQPYENDCVNTFIVSSKIVFDGSKFNYLDFKPFFIPEDCIKIFKPDSEDFYKYKVNILNSGGRIERFKNNSILFTIGVYSDFKNHAQDNNSSLGKLFSINLDNGKSKIIAKGLRNSQGLFYDNLNDMIYLTDHGPQGGDEINIISSNMIKSNKIINFGYPISSYGEHYGFKERDDNDPKYKVSTLYKSHKDYGFVEPKEYFVPSIGISQIIGIPNEFTNYKNKEFFFGSLGRSIDVGLSVFYYAHNKNLLTTDLDKLKINQRIRDIIYISKYKTFFIFGETYPQIITLRANTVMDEFEKLKKKK